MITEDVEQEIPEDELQQLMKEAEERGEDPALVPRTRVVKAKVRRRAS
jgi:hypothetical protein